MPECQECGGHVTPNFVRVFGEDGEVHGCISCESRAGDGDRYRK